MLPPKSFNLFCSFARWHLFNTYCTAHLYRAQDKRRSRQRSLQRCIILLCLQTKGSRMLWCPDFWSGVFVRQLFFLFFVLRSCKETTHWWDLTTLSFSQRVYLLLLAPLHFIFSASSACISFWCCCTFHFFNLHKCLFTATTSTAACLNKVVLFFVEQM